MANTKKPRRTLIEVSLLDDMRRTMGAMEAHAKELLALRQLIDQQADRIQSLEQRIRGMDHRSVFVDCGFP